MSHDQFLCVRYKVLGWDWRSKDPKDLFRDHEHAHTLFLDLISPLYTWEAQFIFQIVKIAHKIRNCVYITSILSFHYFVSFWAIWLYHIRSSYRGFRGYEPKDLGASTLCLCYIYCLGFYLVMLGAEDLLSTFWTGNIFPKSTAAVDTGHINNTSDLLY